MSAARHNVILLTVDSLRADSVGGPAGRSLTPNLDRLAASAAVFPLAFSQGPYTNMSMPSLFTGRYPSHLALLEGRGQYGVSVRAAPTLATALAQAGYHTLGFHSNPFLSRAFGFDRGFTDFYDDLLFDGAWLLPRGKLLLNRVRRLSRPTPYLPAAALNHRVLAGLEKAREPFFLWAHFMDAHGPYQPRRGWSSLAKLRAERLWRKATRRPAEVTPAERQELWAAYRGRVSYLDEQLGVLLEALARQGLLEKSLLVVTADHGDEFFEHGGYTHSHQLYDELIHVPLLLRAPGVVPRRVEEIVELVQIVPTVLDWVSVPAPDGLDGESFRPVLEGGGGNLRGTSLSEAELGPRYIGCLRERQWKFIGWEPGGREELYDLGADPGERRNVVTAYPDVADALRRKWYERRREEARPAPAEKLSLEDEKLVEARLRDLGYL